MAKRQPKPVDADRSDDESGSPDTVKFRLNHFCHSPGAEGTPGDEIEITREQADMLLARKGGVVVRPAPSADGAPRKPKKVKPDEDTGNSDEAPAGDVDGE